MTIELDFSPLNQIVAVFGLLILVYGSVSFFVKEKLFLGEAPIAVLVGIVLGPYGIGQLLTFATEDGMDSLDSVALGLSRIVIGIQLTLVGIQLPHKYLKFEWKSLLVLLMPVMTIMWLCTTTCIYMMIPNLSLLGALVIASCATPTDPVLSNSIVKGAFADQYVSPRLRNAISAESGANDGLGYPFLFLAIYLLKKPTTGEALKSWILETWLYVVIVSAIFGAVVGYLVRQMLKFSSSRNLIDKESFLVFGIAMGIFLVGLAGALGMDDLLACFVAGNVLTWDDWYRQQTEQDEVQNVIDMLLNLSFFIFLGATIPFAAFHDPSGTGVTLPRLLGLAVLVLLFRRLPALLLMYRFTPTMRDVSEAAFMGYFGPIGAGTVFYCSLVLEQFSKEKSPGPEGQRIREIVKPVTYFLICSSIIAHGLAIPFVKMFFVWRGVGSIKLVGDDEDAASYKSDEYEEAYESGEAAAPQPERSLSEASEMAEARPRTSRQTSKAEGGASWRHSTGHKLGPHYQVIRNEHGADEVVHEDDLESVLRHRASISHFGQSPLRPNYSRSQSQGRVRKSAEADRVMSRETFHQPTRARSYEAMGEQHE